MTDRLRLPRLLHQLHAYVHDGEQFTADLDSGVSLPTPSPLHEIIQMCGERAVVVDTSVAVAFAVGDEPNSSAAMALMRRLIATRRLMVSPPLFGSETDSALRLKAFHGRIGPGNAILARAALDGPPVTIVYDPRVRQRAREIAEELNQERVYDSTYAALADIRGCELWTGDHAFHAVASLRFGFVRYILEAEAP